jgi:hypothetical protein
MFRPVAATLPDAVAHTMPSNPKTHVSFRMSVSYASSYNVLQTPQSLPLPLHLTSPYFALPGFTYSY